jgi:hypothetical protein
MRWKGSLISFVGAFSLSLVLSGLIYPTTSSVPGFTKEESVQRVGRRVRCVAAPDGEINLMRNVKGEFAVIPVGSRGTIRDFKRMPSGSYFVVIEWDGTSANGPWRSTYGKDYQRAGIVEE